MGLDSLEIVFFKRIKIAVAKPLQHESCQIQTCLGYNKEPISQTQLGLVVGYTIYTVPDIAKSRFRIHNSYQCLGVHRPTLQIPRLWIKIEQISASEKKLVAMDHFLEFHWILSVASFQS
jgi:hypothetical protein